MAYGWQNSCRSRLCNFLQFGDATFSKNILHFSPKSACKKHLCGHSDMEFRKEKLISHLKNIENLKIDEHTKQNTIGFETYSSKYEDSNGNSEIVFTIDKN